MRKLVLYFLAAFILTSCDNLKVKKSSTTEDDTEETTKKKKKKTLEDEEESDEESTKLKKGLSDDSEEDEYTSNDDEEESTTVSWDKANRKIFMDNCVDKAEQNVGYDRAKQYCSCMLEKIERAYPDPNDVSNMSEAKRDKMVQECNSEL